MTKFRMWDPTKNDDYWFFDGIIAEQFDVGGTAIFVHKYLGIHDQGDTGDKTQPGFKTPKERQIQDMLFLENRDRAYDPNIYELSGVYQVGDAEFDLRQFGLFLENDTIYITFHINTMIDRLGRKIMSGDVFELPHLRDDALLDADAPAINKYYVVEDAMRAAEGFSPTWFPHIWRVKCKPLTDAQEYRDILDRESEDNPGLSVRDLISTFHDEIGISEAIREEAEAQVPQRNFETAHFYVVPGAEDGLQYPWIFAGDGKPPNGAEPAGSGIAFPSDAQEGDWWLKTDMEPNVLYRREGSLWVRKEVDWRKKWHAAHRILESFINNRNTTDVQGEKMPEKQMLSKAIKPKADF